jgi:hypothetical protein
VCEAHAILLTMGLKRSMSGRGLFANHSIIMPMAIRKQPLN